MPPQSSSEEDRGEEEEEEEENHDDGECRSTITTKTVVPLPSWLTMVLPVVGCAIHPDVYSRMRDDIVVRLEEITFRP